MAVNIEKYVHILGANTISQLITYLGIVFAPQLSHSPS